MKELKTLEYSASDAEGDQFGLTLPKPSKVEIAWRIAEKWRHPNFIISDRFAAEPREVPVYSYPVEEKFSKQISQLFGANPSTYAPLKGHDGIDWWLVVRSYILAPADMTITDTILQTKSYGRHAWSLDEFGHRNIFGHLHEFLCKKGDFIKRGQAFASSGGNLDDPYHGFSTGPHLHWEVRPSWASISNGYAGAENQLPWITYGQVTPTPPPEAKPIAKLVVTNPAGLTVRRSSSIYGASVRILKVNEEVYLYDIGQNDLWGKIDPYANEFVAIQYNKKFYTKVKEFLNI
jgi:murein DD-endopeptidase MepM/ murein hydrolase activator NlpD